MAHGDVYVAETTPAHINHFYRAVMDANAYPGPPCSSPIRRASPSTGSPMTPSIHQSKLAVDSRAFPLFTYDPRRGPTMRERLSLQGNPALRKDWDDLPGRDAGRLPRLRPDGGSVRPPLRADGTPTPEMLATQEDRLANWRTLQELAGIAGTTPALPRP